MVPVELRLSDRSVDTAQAVVHMPQVPRAGEYVQHGDALLQVDSVAWRFGKAPAGDPTDLQDQWFVTLVCRPAEAQPTADA